MGPMGHHMDQYRPVFADVPNGWAPWALVLVAPSINKCTYSYIHIYIYIDIYIYITYIYRERERD
jgi:hypothetical protein